MSENHWSAARKNNIAELSCEPSDLCSFASLQTNYYSDSYLRQWSSKWVPSYCWSAEGLIADPIKTYLFADAVILKDSYDLFYRLSDGTFQCAPSYSSLACQQYSRCTWNAFHNPGLSLLRLQQISDKAIERIDGSLVFPLIWHRDHQNYWHFSFDIAFRLFYLQQVHSYLLNKIELAVVGQESLKPFQLQLIEAILGYLPRVHYVSQAVQCKHAIYIPPVQTLLPRHGWLVQYASHLKAALGVNTTKMHTEDSDLSRRVTGSHSRLYIQRGNAKNPRQLYNEAEVTKLLASNGFGCVDPGAYSLVQQAQLFSDACCVLGLHGSAFVNMIFMRPGAQVIELTNSSYDPFHDFLLARQLGLYWQRLCTRSQNVRCISHAPFHANISMIKRCLRIAL